MSRYPAAEWIPWKPIDPRGRPTFYKGRNQPIAAVLHIQEGWASTARRWANEGHYGASWHFTVARDGHVMQHLDFEDGGYHAGITDVQARQKPPVWPLWKGVGINVNHYTIGIEHEGFHDERWPDAQRAASRDLLTWLSGELDIPAPASDSMVVGALALGDRYLLHYPPHAAIDRINRVNDFAPIPQRAEFYDWLKQGDDMTPEEKAMLEELWRRTGGDRGRNFDLLQLVDNQNTALTRHIDEHPDSPDTVPEHKHTLATINVTGGLQR